MKRKNLVRLSFLLMVFLCLFCFVACNEETMNEINDNVTAQTNEQQIPEGQSPDICRNGHTEGAWVIDMPADKCNDGSRHRNCSVCGELLSTEVIPAKGSEGLAYQTYDDGTCIITGKGTCTDQDIYIPSQIDGNKVTSIGKYAFENMGYGVNVQIPIISITIGDGITNIGSGAFRYCTALTSVTIPDSVTSIGNWAFDNCINLKSITIPDSVTSIGERAFQFCDNLKSVYASNLETWCKISFLGPGSNPLQNGADLYLNGTKVTMLQIPDSVTSIGGYAFSGCSSLESVTIPDSVTSIGGYAFSGCSKLTSVTIPDSITSIGGYAFSGCSKLTSVTIPDSITSIGGYAFRNCDSLTDIYFTGTEEEWNAIEKSNAQISPSATIHYN